MHPKIDLLLVLPNQCELPAAGHKLQAMACTSHRCLIFSAQDWLRCIPSTQRKPYLLYCHERRLKLCVKVWYLEFVCYIFKPLLYVLLPFVVFQRLGRQDELYNLPVRVHNVHCDTFVGFHFNTCPNKCNCFNRLQHLFNFCVTLTSIN